MTGANDLAETIQGYDAGGLNIVSSHTILEKQGFQFGPGLGCRGERDAPAGLVGGQAFLDCGNRQKALAPGVQCEGGGLATLARPGVQGRRLGEDGHANGRAKLQRRFDKFCARKKTEASGPTEGAGHLQDALFADGLDADADVSQMNLSHPCNHVKA
jgi:hypothetical protein